MTNGDDNQPATKNELKALRKELPQVIEKVMHDKTKDLATKTDLVHWKDEILTSNDKVVKQLDRILTEQKAITVNYERLDSRMHNVEAFAEQAAQKLQIEFERV